MEALLIDAAAVPRPLQRVALAGQGLLDEKWLQALLFEHPGAVPVDLIDSGAGLMVPICREFPIPKEGTHWRRRQSGANPSLKSSSLLIRVLTAKGRRWDLVPRYFVFCFSSLTPHFPTL